MPNNNKKNNNNSQYNFLKMITNRINKNSLKNQANHDKIDQSTPDDEKKFTSTQMEDFINEERKISNVKNKKNNNKETKETNHYFKNQKNYDAANYNPQNRNHEKKKYYENPEELMAFNFLDKIKKNKNNSSKKLNNDWTSSTNTSKNNPSLNHMVFQALESYFKKHNSQMNSVFLKVFSDKKMIEILFHIILKNNTELKEKIEKQILQTAQKTTEKFILNRLHNSRNLNL